VTRRDEERLRIAMVAPPWFAIPPVGYGGIESMVYLLTEGLVERGHDVTLIGAGPTTTSARYRATFTRPPSDKVGDAVLEVVHAARVSDLLRELRPHVVHDHSVAGPLLADDRPLTILTAHGPSDGGFIEYYEVLTRRVRVVAISEAQRNLAPQIRWFATVHNAIPVEQYPFRAEKEDFVLFLGRMSPDKGAHLAIETARKVGRPLLLAGKCSEPTEKEYFHTQIEPALDDRVRWLGEVDDETKKDLLSRAWCLLFPIQWEEPFGLVMAEAMACGTPVVACPRGAAPELVRDGVTGYLRQDVAPLAQAVEECGSIEPKTCREHVRERFDVDVMVSGYEDVYRRAITEAR
jgi:glycosyltransferase involved in cell wall biosynthesis